MNPRVTLLVTLVLAVPRPGTAQGTAYEQLQSFTGALGQVRQNYVDSVDVGTLVRASIEGMLRALDPHSHYMTRRDMELFTLHSEGELAGPGLVLDDAVGGVVVLSVTPDGPAARGGVQSGDRVVAINGEPVDVLPARAVEARLLGAADSKVGVTVERGDSDAVDSFTVQLKRVRIERMDVSTPLLIDPTTGYLRLAEFTSTAPKALADAIRKIRGLGATRLILDLRGNPGGDLGAMSEIASLFLPAQSRLFRVEGRRPAMRVPITTTERGDFDRLPLAVLLDAGSASASELLAGALQDHDRALVVGRRSFGKALMQTTLPLPNGDVIWLTTARLLTPSGRIIQRRYAGVTAEQYFQGAGHGGAAPDTLPVYRTDRGREVRGGGGISPDLPVPGPPQMPVWYSAALDSGYVDRLVGNLVPTLGSSTPKAWIGDRAAWDTRLAAPLLALVQDQPGAGAPPDAKVRARLGVLLAARVARARWGESAEQELMLRNDPDIEAALGGLDRLPSLLGS